MGLYDDIVNASLDADEFPGLYDEAMTRLAEDIKTAAQHGHTEFHWFGSDYPSITGTINEEILAEWLLKEGFRVSYVPNSKPRLWMCRWTLSDNNKEEDEEDNEDDDEWYTNH